MRIRLFILLITCSLSLVGCSRSSAGASITQDELVKRTQELFNSVAAGDQTPWRKYFADDCMYFDETGHAMNKEQLVAGVTPLPAGYSGSIKMGKVESRIEGDVAILSYDLDESETVFGQTMKARYHATDTWMKRGGVLAEWKIVAGQIFRYYEDPADGQADVKKYPEYVGVYAAGGKTMTVTLDGGKLYRQRGDRAKQELIPEAEGIFFRRGVEGRTLFRRGADGKVDALIDRRNNEDIVWGKR